MVEHKIKRFLPFRLALRSLCVLATLATLGTGLASVAHAQCNPLGGLFVCGSGCIPVTAECCSNGGYCNHGHCWSARGTVFCCPVGQYGTANGQCRWIGANLLDGRGSRVATWMSESPGE
jgi:hypothetical protein